MTGPVPSSPHGFRSRRAFHLGLLDVDFEVENPQAHPELVEHLARLAARYRRAAES